ncbi:MAG TPA: carbohydrate deacetylase [Vicinamibacteria bacterium]|nr:carbohydrate deacetylase [Vicinamibacteria bacterium]
MTAPDGAKRLIVNADDLGRTPGINQGIFEAHDKGVVTSATLMVNHPAARAVPELSARHPGLGIGLHVALTGGVPASPREHVPSLVDGQGRLPSAPDGLAGAQAEHVLAEARAQLRRFREIMGREPTHFDSHHHSHRRPVVLEALLTLAWETGLPVRNVSEEAGRTLARENVPTTDRFVDGFYDQGATMENLLRILVEVPPGTTELMCHPARVDDELRGSSSYADSRERELALLTDREVRQQVQALGIRLIHFGELR